MRRVSRLESAIVRYRSTAPSTCSIPCAACRLQRAAFSTSTARAASTSFTDRLRKKIWGTESPPGQEDPYGGQSAWEKSRAAKKQSQEAASTEVSEEWQGMNMEAYEPAESWDGLEEVGGKDYTDIEEPQFHGFIPAERSNDPFELSAALRRSVIEVFSLQAAGKPLSILSSAAVEPDMTGDIRIIPSATGSGAELEFSGQTTLDQVTEFLARGKEDLNDSPTPSEEDVAADRSMEDPLHPESLPGIDKTKIHNNPTPSEEDVAADQSPEDPLHPESLPGIDKTKIHNNPTPSEEDVAADRSTVDPLPSHQKSLKSNVDAMLSQDPIWLNISVKDAGVKFTIIKRVMQLTGVKLSDPDISNLDSIGDILGALAYIPPPKKLADVIVEREELLNLPNVKVYSRRVTPIDTEVSVGRWKLIEKELQERDLPVTGH